MKDPTSRIALIPGVCAMILPAADAVLAAGRAELGMEAYPEAGVGSQTP